LIVKAAMSVAVAVGYFASARGLRVVILSRPAKFGEAIGFGGGVRIEERFKRVADHPLLAGLSEQHLRDWRGEATILPAKLSYEFGRAMGRRCSGADSGAPVVAVRESRECASALIRSRRAGIFGRFWTVDLGFSMPRCWNIGGEGVVLFCQMDVSGRSENDPARGSWRGISWTMLRLETDAAAKCTVCWPGGGKNIWGSIRTRWRFVADQVLWWGREGESWLKQSGDERF